MSYCLRQIFWSHRKGEGQSYLKFLKDEEGQFDRVAQRMLVKKEYDSLKQLISIEEFMNCVLR